MNRLSVFTIWSALLGLLLLTASWTASPSGRHISNGSSRMPSFAGTRWQMVSFTLAQPIDYDGDGTIDSDLTKFLRPCDLDNTIRFEPTGNLLFSSGRINCNGADMLSRKSANWLFDEATKTIRITDGGTERISEWEVLEASASVLKVAVHSTDHNPANVAVVTWKRA